MLTTVYVVQAISANNRVSYVGRKCTPISTWKGDPARRPTKMAYVLRDDYNAASDYYNSMMATIDDEGKAVEKSNTSESGALKYRTQMLATADLAAMRREIDAAYRLRVVPVQLEWGQPETAMRVPRTTGHHTGL